MQAITLDLTAHKPIFIKFCDWYKSKGFKIELKSYLLLDFEYQSVILLQFLNENNVHIVVGNDFYIIYSILTIDKNRKKTIKFIDELTIDKSLPTILHDSILLSFNYLNNPF